MANSFSPAVFFFGEADFFLRFMPLRENSKRIQAKSTILSQQKNSYRYSYSYRFFRTFVGNSLKPKKNTFRYEKVANS